MATSDGDSRLWAGHLSPHLDLKAALGETHYVHDMRKSGVRPTTRDQRPTGRTETITQLRNCLVDNVLILGRVETPDGAVRTSRAIHRTGQNSCNIRMRCYYG